MQHSPHRHADARRHMQGQNMVVGMGDTGMDVFHCHISDNRIIPSAFSSTNLLLVERSTGYLYFDSTTHRKVRYYRLFKDNIDANGHGTHCAGSAVGSPQFGSLPPMQPPKRTKFKILQILDKNRCAEIQPNSTQLHLVDMA